MQPTPLSLRPARPLRDTAAPAPRIGATDEPARGYEPRLQRLLIHSHGDDSSLLRRDVAIAGRLLARSARLQVMLLTGSPAVEGLALPRGLSIVRLPGVPSASPLAAATVRRARAAIVADVARRFEPDSVLVDGELRSPALWGAASGRRESPSTGEELAGRATMPRRAQQHLPQELSA